MTEDNIKKLVVLTNEEIKKMQSNSNGNLEIIINQIGKSNEKLERLYNALETGKLDLDILAPRIKMANCELERLEKQNMT